MSLFDGIGAIAGAGINYFTTQAATDKATKSAAEINAKQIAETDKVNALQLAAAKEAAQNSVSWKVADARAAGINPLVALGAATASVPALSVPSLQKPDLPSQPHTGDAVGAGLGQLLNAVYGEDAQLDRRQKEAQIAQMDAQTRLLEAQSRTELARATRSAQGADVQIAGVPVHRTPGYSTAEEVGKDYGWMVNGPYGVARAARDAAQTAHDAASERAPSWLHRFWRFMNPGARQFPGGYSH
jgi:hypothetical protein